MSINSSFAKVALPYAEALFESSQVMQIVEKTRKDLDLILKTFEQSRSLQNFLANPLIKIKAKKDVLNNLFMNQVSEYILNFLSILIDRRRITLFSAIV